MKARFDFRASELRSVPGFEGAGVKEFRVLYPSTAKAPRDNSIIFVKQYPGSGLGPLASVKDCIVLVPAEQASLFESLTAANLVLPTAVPRLAFAQLLSFIVAREQETRGYRMLPNGAVIGENVSLGEGVVIEPQAFVSHDVKIGDRSVIRSGARVLRFVEIGTDTVIRENAVIGGPGFGFERTPEGIPVRLPHLGGVLIGDRVEIGALTTIVAGTIDPTVIMNDAKVDDHVHIAHNCILERGTLVTACAEVSGSVRLGEFSWLGPNCSILQGLEIGAGATVGLGAVVTKSVPGGSTVAGNPAEPTQALKVFNAAKRRLLLAVEQDRI